MKIKKSLLSVFLCISLMCGSFVPSITVYASSGDESEPNFLDRFNDKFYEITKSVSGVILSPVAGVKDSFKQWLGEHKDSYGGSGQSTDDFISSNFSYDNDSYNIKGNLINSMRDFNQYYINSSSDYIYAYSYGASDWQDRFENPALYNSFINVLSEYDGHIVVCYTRDYNWPSLIVVYEDYVKPVFSTGGSGAISCSLYTSANDITDSDDYLAVYVPSGSNYVSDTNSGIANLAFFKQFADDSIVSLPYGYRATNSEPTLFQIFDSSSGAFNSSEGVQDYYISDSYNTSHVDNSSTVTYTRSEIDNSITYTDVADFVNTYYLTNNNYPTTNTVYQYINNYEGGSDNPDNPDDPDNPEDPEDGEGIWALIKKVLDFIAKLFDTIAGFLADLVDSLGDLVNSVVSNILNLITSITDNIPNAMGNLLEYFFGFLPDELLALITLSISVMVIVGIIRLIRGS